MMKSMLCWLMCCCSAISLADCRDKEAMAASDELALKLLRDAEIFHPAKVLKVHHPGRRKEITSYIKAKEKHYSIFTLVDAECQAVFRKRTRQHD